MSMVKTHILGGNDLLEACSLPLQ